MPEFWTALWQRDWAFSNIRRSVGLRRICIVIWLRHISGPRRQSVKCWRQFNDRVCLTTCELLMTFKESCPSYKFLQQLPGCVEHWTLHRISLHYTEENETHSTPNISLPTATACINFRRWHQRLLLKNEMIDNGSIEELNSVAEGSLKPPDPSSWACTVPKMFTAMVCRQSLASEVMATTDDCYLLLSLSLAIAFLVPQSHYQTPQQSDCWRRLWELFLYFGSLQFR